jgi:hypothetical protein
MAKHLTTKTVAELVSGCISPFQPTVLVEGWTPDQIRDDGLGVCVAERADTRIRLLPAIQPSVIQERILPRQLGG